MLHNNSYKTFAAITSHDKKTVCDCSETLRLITVKHYILAAS